MKLKWVYMGMGELIFLEAREGCPRALYYTLLDIQHT